MQMRVHNRSMFQAYRSCAPRLQNSCRFYAVAHTHRVTVKNRATHAPTPAETARTIVELCSDGTFCTVCSDGTPAGTAVSYAVDNIGCLHVNLPSDGLELQNLSLDSRCCLHIQPTTYPARAVASVTLVGKVQSDAQQGGPVPMLVDKCIYFGGLEQVS